MLTHKFYPLVDPDSITVESDSLSFFGRNGIEGKEKKRIVIPFDNAVKNRNLAFSLDEHGNICLQIRGQETLICIGLSDQFGQAGDKYKTPEEVFLAKIPKALRRPLPP